jgi:PASTA domain
VVRRPRPAKCITVAKEHSEQMYGDRPVGLRRRDRGVAGVPVWRCGRFVALAALSALVVAVAPLVVASGRAAATPPADLPPLVGLPVDDALQKLAQLKVAAQLDPDLLPDGVDRSLVLVLDVIDTSIHIDPGPTNAVRLVLGSSVPDLAGLTAAEAARLAGLRGLVVQRSPADVPDTAIVTEQRPASATLVRIPGVVTAQVVPVVTVPDVGGKSVSGARAALQAAGLRLTVQQLGPGPDFGPVASQRPAAGTRVPAGTVVTAEVNTQVSRPEQVTVPDVIGLEPAQARRTLEASALTLAPVTVGSGRVRAVQQSPAARSRVNRGARVTVRFESGAPGPTGTTSRSPEPGTPAGPSGAASVQPGTPAIAPVASHSVGGAILLLVFLAAAVLATAAIGGRRARARRRAPRGPDLQRRHPPHSDPRVEVRGRPSTAATTVTDQDPSLRASVRFEPRADQGRQTLEENPHG